MALLSNGLNTIEYGDLGWKTTLNTNFSLMSSKKYEDDKISLLSDSTHNHDSRYMDIYYSISINDFSPLFTSFNNDIYFSEGYGPIFTDRSTGLIYRVVVVDGVVSIEEVSLTLTNTNFSNKEESNNGWIY